MHLKALSMFAAVLLVAACAGQEMESVSSEGTMESSGQVAAGPAAGSAQDFLVNVGDRVFFGYDRFNLTAESRATLERQAVWLNQYSSARINVEGHADERGTREYNLALGDRRASAVKNYLVANGVSAGRITTISYGKEQPAMLGSNEAAWAQNRRGVSIIN